MSDLRWRLGMAAGLGRAVSRGELRDMADLRPAPVSEKAWMAMDTGARCAAILSHAAAPEACGPDYIAAPAAGPRKVVRLERMVHGSSERVTDAGWQGRSTVARADVFDAMLREAERRGAARPLSAGQIEIGRRYRALVERHSAGGVRCASLEAEVRGPGGGAFIDAHIAIGDEIEALRRRVGQGVALRVQRGAGRRSVTFRALVDDVCLADRTLNGVLRRHGWAPDGTHRAALRRALAGSLDRMRCFIG